MNRRSPVWRVLLPLFPLVHGQVAWGADADVGACDRLTTLSVLAPKESVPFERLDAQRAIPACEAAVRTYPANNRLIFELGRAYLKGENYPAALKRFHQAADRGYAPALNAIGQMYAQGTGVAKDVPASIDWIRKGAEEGDAAAQLNLALVYEKGEGVARDYALALKWYRLAAEQGSAAAQDNVGYFYTQGWGTKMDHAEAARWFNKAAEQQYAGAQFNLGLLYETGVGVPKSRENALFWYRKAAAQGYERAQKALQQLDRPSASTRPASSSPLASSKPPASAAGSSQDTSLSARLRADGVSIQVDNQDSFNWSRCSIDINFHGLNFGYNYKYFDVAAGTTARISLFEFANTDGERFNPSTHKLQVVGFECETPSGKRGWGAKFEE